MLAAALAVVAAGWAAGLVAAANDGGTPAAVTAPPAVELAQNLAPNPTAPQPGLFCDLCKIQGCSCSSDGQSCVNCGGALTANANRDADATEKVCLSAKGNFSRGKCALPR
jgi:hypothetical protein